MVQSDATMRFSGTGNVQVSRESYRVRVIQYVGKGRIPTQRRWNPYPAIRNANSMLYTPNNVVVCSGDIIASRPLRMFHSVQSQLVKDAHHFNEWAS